MQFVLKLNRLRQVRFTASMAHDLSRAVIPNAADKPKRAHTWLNADALPRPQRRAQVGKMLGHQTGEHRVAGHAIAKRVIGGEMDLVKRTSSTLTVRL